ncbi:MAG: hydrogenase expression/formation protein HypE [Elusimicrobia bacterium CG_4_10_14_0_2_um_filter_56_8]|nr:MAG: hydrogenase expression/formation protein HypE [Elusimicrobia bacterium CG1_02_56_21]PJA12472.1 MAG: hydrogenase expression/formation protein HypE [Elusimicrobia bacterium CG_4_10_14_0_2_um_filter_56_8]
MTALKKIVLGHGSGGRLSRELVERVFLKSFSNPSLRLLEDAAEVKIPGATLAFTTDSYVVTPVEFPGADIGRVAVCGTVNDLAVKGARPLALSAGFILEEGFPGDLLLRITASMRRAADEAGVLIVTGDTKVVEKGKADGIFINTSGLGLIPRGRRLTSAEVKPGDAIIVSGNLADHGVAVMNARDRLGLRGGVRSDAAPLNGLIEKILRLPGIRAMRDLTRGGLATVLNEVSGACRLTAEVEEDSVAVSPAARSACSLLGLDPMYVANEGKIAVFAAPGQAAKILKAMRSHPYGRNACIAGRMLKEKKPLVRMITSIGGSRIMLMLEGEQLPRIC